MQYISRCLIATDFIDGFVNDCVMTAVTLRHAMLVIYNACTMQYVYPAVLVLGSAV